MEQIELIGYRRAQGNVGIRNHVVVVAMDQLAGLVASSAARLVPGVIEIINPYGRTQYSEDSAVGLRVLEGIISNANVGGAVVLSSDDRPLDQVICSARAAGIEVTGHAVRGKPELSHVQVAVESLRLLMQQASEMRRSPIAIGELTIAMKCGESDNTSALAACPVTGLLADRLVDAGARVIFGETSELTGSDNVIADRCIDHATRAAFKRAFDACVRQIIDQGYDLLGSQPTEGNIRGGITTIEEKSLGSVAKTGSRPIVGVLGQGEPPLKPGLHFMDTSSGGAECLTAQLAAGSVLFLFPTGQGNILGSPIAPVVKLSANASTVDWMGSQLDFDCSGVIAGEETIESAADVLFSVVVRTISGRLTGSEVSGHRELAMPRIHRSA